MARKREMEPPPASDMSPMIDMVFQLLIFFMILINFSDADQNARVNLPQNNIVKPPEAPIPDCVTLQIAPLESNKRDFCVLIGADEIRTPIKQGRAHDMSRLRMKLKSEVDFVKRKPGGKTAKDMTVIIRADVRVKTGYVQEVIHACQEEGLEKFALRAKQVQ